MGKSQFGDSEIISECSSQGGGVKGGAVPTEMNLNEWMRKQGPFLSKTMSWSLYMRVCGLSVSLGEA